MYDHTSLEDTIALIQRSVDLDPNDDAWDGVVPLPQAFQDAIKFVRSLPVGSIMPLFASVHNGEISLFWTYGNSDQHKYFYLDVGFIGDGLYCYYGDIPMETSKEIHGDDLEIKDNIEDEKILEFLKELKEYLSSI